MARIFIWIISQDIRKYLHGTKSNHSWVIQWKGWIALAGWDDLLWSGLERGLERGHQPAKKPILQPGRGGHSWPGLLCVHSISHTGPILSEPQKAFKCHEIQLPEYIFPRHQTQAAKLNWHAWNSSQLSSQ